MERFKHKVQNLLFTQSKSMYTDKQCLCWKHRSLRFQNCKFHHVPTKIHWTRSQRKPKLCFTFEKKNKPSMNSVLPLTFCFNKIHGGDITAFPAHFHLLRCNFDLFRTAMCWFMVSFILGLLQHVFKRVICYISKKWHSEKYLLYLFVFHPWLRWHLRKPLG